MQLLLRRAERVMHSMRAYRTATDKRLLEDLGRIASRNVTSESQLSDEEKRFAEEAIIKAALGSSSRSMPRPPVRPAPVRAKTDAKSQLPVLQVSVRFGDVAEIVAPAVVVGHYRGVLPTNAIGAIDKKLGGWITRAVRQGMIAGTLGETFYIPTAGRLGAQSVVVAGMGEFGRFGATDLRLLMSNIAQGASALGYSTIATVLVGAGNGNLDRETALREILEGLGNGLAQLRRMTRTPIAAGENISNFMEFKRLFEAGAVGIAQPSITKIGGVTEMRKIFALGEANGVVVVPHSPYFGPGLLASIHVCAASAREIPIERYYCDFTDNPFGDQIIPKNGDFAVPQAPGLGQDPNLELVERMRVK
jgi:hypothetical protein